jgi:predicted RNase H-like HicB family nuclease
MNSRGFTYWQDGGVWLGFLDDFPDYMTQGESLDDLKAHLQSLHEDLMSGEIPCVRRHAQLEIA